MSFSGKIAKVMIWDTAGQEKYSAITQNYYRGSHGMIYVYDVTNATSFRNISTWLRNAQEVTDNDKVKRILIGLSMQITALYISSL